MMEELAPIRYKPAPPFCQMLRASGAGETWIHGNDPLKMKQFGWKSTTSESGYTPKTLIGNWCEERWDIDVQRQVRPLPSQYAHQYETVYHTYFNDKNEKPPDVLHNLAATRPKIFPGHQSDLDHPAEKAIYNSWETTQRQSYADPDIRRTPLNQLPDTCDHLNAVLEANKSSASDTICKGPVGSIY